jgi:acyl-CoA reductase-like NAD-dependent aldehyde dehydrogenase
MAYAYRKFYIDGNWVGPAVARDFTVINPATEEPAGVICVGDNREQRREGSKIVCRSHREDVH